MVVQAAAIVARPSMQLDWLCSLQRLMLCEMQRGRHSFNTCVDAGSISLQGMLLFGPPGTGKTLIARQIGKMLNGKEAKVVNGPEVGLQQDAGQEGG
eukprot:1159832-Pelagomonas_calceolata.AAC.5